LETLHAAAQAQLKRQTGTTRRAGKFDP